MSLTFGSLKRVQLHILFLAGFYQVSCHCAISYPPLDRRVGEIEAIFTGGEFFRLLAAFTLINNRVAGAAIKLAAFLAHKKALITTFCTCTNHDNHILSLKFDGFVKGPTAALRFIFRHCGVL